jgi:hypothetical protein
MNLSQCKGLPSIQSPKDMDPEDIYGSVEITLSGEELNSLKRFLQTKVKDELDLRLVLIMDKENWKRLMKGHNNSMLLSVTFEDKSDFLAINDGEPLEEGE